MFEQLKKKKASIDPIMANDPGPNFKINTQMVLVSFQGWKRELSANI